MGVAGRYPHFISPLVWHRLADGLTAVALYVSAEGTPMHSTSGGRPPAVFLSDLLEAPHRGR